MIPAWVFLSSICGVGLLIIAGVIVGLWAGFKVKTVGTGYSFVRPSEPKPNGKPTSYVSDLFNALGQPLETDLEEEKLSKEAQRIRDQKLKASGPIADVIRDVEGLS